MKFNLKILISLFVASLFFTCTDRERLNPIDPKNPETGGRPEILRIYSEFDRAVIQWKKLQLNGIQGYGIYRRQAPSSAFVPIYQAPPESTQFNDDGLVFGQKYDYYITILGGDFETASSDTASIIPGPTVIWSTDVYNRRILKISHDGSHEIKQIPVDGYPWALAYDNNNDILWYTDVFLNRVYTVKSQTFEIVLNLSNSEPIDLVLDKSNDRIWIADETQGRIFVFNRQGEKIRDLDGFKNPVSIDCMLNDGTCWIADAEAGTVTKISNLFQPIVQIRDLINPTSVSVNQRNGDCWVADSSRILKFDTKGRLKFTISSTVNLPRRLAVDSGTGNCWVLDFSLYANQSRLYCFNDNGDKLLEVPGFSWPENLKINPFDHSCIVTDSGAGRILKISPDGTTIGQITGYDYPRGLFIEF